jgi:tRNA pseudouridine55 synthase
MAVSGILNLFKPAGVTSMEVVRRVKRATRDPKVGHGGTLDPIADGVLPIFFGNASRIMEYLIDSHKAYHVEAAFGVSTDTMDVAGQVAQERDVSGLTRQMVESALQGFLGTIAQTPPMYSALKHEGQRLYELARRGEETPRKARMVEVTRFDLLDWSPPSATFVVECGRGTYVRSLVHDLGEALGCGAHVTMLTRTRSGPFTADDAVTLEQLEAEGKDGTWPALLHPADSVLLDMPAAIVLKPMASAICQGQQVPLAADLRVTLQHGQLCRVYTEDGEFIAIVRYDHSLGLWQPVKVFAAQSLFVRTGSRETRSAPSEPESTYGD